MRKVAIILTALISTLHCFGQPKKFPLTADVAFVNQNGRDDINKLIDRNYGKGRYTIWNPQFLPYTVTFDLGLLGLDNATPKELHYQFNTGSATTQNFYYVRKDNGQKILFYTLTQGTYDNPPKENVVAIPSQAIASRIIVESMNGWGDFPDWFEIWGDFTERQIGLPKIVRSPICNLVGVVTKPWDIAFNVFPEKEAPIKGMVNRERLYSDHNLTFDSAGNLTIASGFWKEMDNMKRLQADGIQTQLCYLDIPEYPFPTGSARLNPDTYVSLAKRVFQICAHNKNNGHYFNVFELGNEWNKWYGQNPSVEFTDGYALACIMSVCYDGHKGKYPGCGAKTADPNILFSMCGLASANLDIWYQVTEWTIANRGYRSDGTPDYPFDIYSYHSYSSLSGQYGGGAPGGVPPEIGMAPQMARVNWYRKMMAPWVKIHIGEWSGGDINSGSPLNAPAFGQYSADQTCAMWTVRALSLMAENETDASSNYRIVQDWPNNDANGGIFGTMAVNRQESAGQKNADGTYTGFNMHRTLSGDYMKQANDVLFNAGYVFDSRLSSSPNVVRFTKQGFDLYMIWSTESMVVTDRPHFTEVTGGYSLNQRGTIRRFVDDLSGVMSSEPFPGGDIAYGSKPVFVIVPNNIQALPVHLISFTAQKINQVSVIKYIVQDAVKVEVERSPDGRSWTNLGEGILNKLVDMHPAFGRNYYRLKMYDADGSFTYSYILSVAIAGVHSKLVVTNVAGQVMKQGWSEDEQRFKSEINNPGIYYFRYESFTETFIKR